MGRRIEGGRVKGRDEPSYSSLSMSSSAVTMFRSCKTRPSSRPADVVPANMDMALTPISRPAACVKPMLANWTFRCLSPNSMPWSPSTAMVVEDGSAYSQNAIPYDDVSMSGDLVAAERRLTLDSSVDVSLTSVNAFNSPNDTNSSLTCSSVK